MGGKTRRSARVRVPSLQELSLILVARFNLAAQIVWDMNQKKIILYQIVIFFIFIRFFSLSRVKRPPKIRCEVNFMPKKIFCIN
jgi:hypothetical protein